MSEVVQMLQTIHPRFDHRFCLEHYGMSASHIHRRLKNLGVNVSVNVYYALLRGQINEAHLGKDKAHAASRLKSIVDSGLVVAMHADTPVAPPRPLEEMWFACNRMADKLTTLPSSKTYSNATSKGNTKMNGHVNGHEYPKTKAMNGTMNGITYTNGHSNGYTNPTTKAMKEITNDITNMNGHSNGHSNPTLKAMNGNMNDITTGQSTGHAYPNKSSNLVSICPSERVSPYQAMRMKTIDAAYVHGLDGVMGSIETGKFADFTILAENPLESDKTRIKDIRVIATVIGGVKRMNVPQTRRVPVPPGDHFLGQVFWMKAMNIVETDMLSSFRRWMLLTIAAYFGSTGTLEDALLVAKEKAHYEISKSRATKKKKKFDTNSTIFAAAGWCMPVSEDEILPSIKSKHVKPTSSMSNCRCC